MVSAVMSVRPMAVSRPSMALRTQVGLPYLRLLRSFNNAIGLFVKAPSIRAWQQYPIQQRAPWAQLQSASGSLDQRAVAGHQCQGLCFDEQTSEPFSPMQPNDRPSSGKPD